MEIPDFPDVVLYAIPAFIALMVLEGLVVVFAHHDDEAGYASADTRTSLFMGLGSLLWDNFVWAVPVGFVNGIIYGTLYSIAPWHVPTSGPEIVLWSLVALVAYDFFYYWSHRGHHVIRLLWATHVVHHSSEFFNLSTALRQPWTSWAGWIFYLPLALMGFHPLMVAFIGGVNLVYQFWIHTERIGTLPRPVEYVFNTPSHHRVHHASQGSYLDRNFGGVFIVWDRWFGSFAQEREKPVYGLTHNIETYNPLKVAFHEYGALIRDIKAAPSWRQRLLHLVKPPGWSPRAQVPEGSLDALHGDRADSA